MTAKELIDIAATSRQYTLHSHTQFCDGRADMATMAAAAAAAGMTHYGFSPHSPLCIESPCNMSRESVAPYIGEAARLKELYAGKMTILTGMEVDYISRDWGPHIDYFQKLPLDYTIGSVHFVPDRYGTPWDCDGRYERFDSYLRTAFRGDLRYVVETYLEQVLRMIEAGGFQILGHADKIAGNAAIADPELESRQWYTSLVGEIIDSACDAGIAIEINTKSFGDKQRFFPAECWWEKLAARGVVPVINSDAHYPERIADGREEAYTRIKAYWPAKDTDNTNNQKQ